MCLCMDHRLWVETLIMPSAGWEGRAWHGMPVYMYTNLAS